MEKFNFSHQVGVLSVHVFGCQQLIMDGDSVPENYQLYGKLSVGPLAKNTSVRMQTKKGKIIWNEVLNFPILVSYILFSYCFFTLGYAELLNYSA